jgi:hypothetical protein
MVMKNSTTAGLLRFFVTVLAAVIVQEGNAFSTSYALRSLKRLCPPSFRREPVRLLATLSKSQTTRDEAVCKVLDLARQMGPIGALQSSEDQERVLSAAKTLAKISDKKPRIGVFEQRRRVVGPVVW